MNEGVYLSPNEYDLLRKPLDLPLIPYGRYANISTIDAFLKKLEKVKHEKRYQPVSEKLVMLERRIEELRYVKRIVVSQRLTMGEALRHLFETAIEEEKQR